MSCIIKARLYSLIPTRLIPGFFIAFPFLETHKGITVILPHFAVEVNQSAKNNTQGMIPCESGNYSAAATTWSCGGRQ